MSDKLLSVIEKIVSNPAKIVEVCESGNEYFFRYADFCWSVVRRDRRHDQFGTYSVYFYPNWRDSTASLARLSQFPNENTPAMTTYHETEYFSESGLNLFAALYKILEERTLGVDQAFDQILAE